MLTTYTGKTVDMSNFKDSDVDIQDIAHSLALINRFNGHSRVPMSVAQHSVYVSVLCHPRNRLQALLHDAAEAYLGDMTKWLKNHHSMVGYRNMERHIEMVIFKHFDLPVDMRSEVEIADELMVRFEAREAFGPSFDFGGMADRYPPITPQERQLIGIWKPWGWEHAEKIFLECFSELTDGDAVELTGRRYGGGGDNGTP